MIKILFFKFFILLLISSCANRPENNVLNCEVTIIGGGAAGVYMAYRLSEKDPKRLCLFEKEAELGGRLRDEFLPSESLSPIWVGTGARRVNESQKFVLELGKELGIKFETPKKKKELIYTKGKHGHSPDDFKNDFPGLRGGEDQLYDLLLKNRKSADQAPDLLSFIKSVVGDKGLEFLKSTSRFRGDYKHPISAGNYLDTTREELKLSSINVYPVGGMSAFIRGMEKRLIERGVRIYRSEPIISLEQQRSKNFKLRSKTFNIASQYVAIATPPSGFNHIKGELADKLRSTKEYKSILAIPIVVINQWWDVKWWDKLDVWRAWTSEGCVHHTEIPQEPYAAKGLVTRSVYTDDPECVRYWYELSQKDKTEFEKAVINGLEKLFTINPNEPLKLPKPLKTSFHFWDGGWYYIKAGSKVSNQEIVDWAHSPLPEVQRLMFVGESYWPNRPGWSEGAYFSTENALKKHFFKKTRP